MTNSTYVAGQATLFPFTPPKHSDDLCIPVQTWEFLCHTLYLKRYPFLLGPKGCGKSSIAKELATAMGMEYFAFDMGQAFKPKKMFVGGLIIGALRSYFSYHAPVIIEQTATGSAKLVAICHSSLFLIFFQRNLDQLLT